MKQELFPFSNFAYPDHHRYIIQGLLDGAIWSDTIYSFTFFHDIAPKLDELRDTQGGEWRVSINKQFKK